MKVVYMCAGKTTHIVNGKKINDLKVVFNLVD